MGLTVVYLETAAPGLRRLKQKDEPAFRRATRAIRALASDPYPNGAVPWGTSGLYRLHEDSLRVLYQVDEGGKTVYVIDVSVVP